MGKHMPRTWPCLQRVGAGDGAARLLAGPVAGCDLSPWASPILNASTVLGTTNPQWQTDEPQMGQLRSPLLWDLVTGTWMWQPLPRV